MFGVRVTLWPLLVAGCGHFVGQVFDFCKGWGVSMTALVFFKNHHNNIKNAVRPQIVLT